MAIRKFPDIKNSLPVDVTLYGADGSIHGTGRIDGKILGDAHFLIHNERHYHFSRVAGSTVYFRECKAPYVVTEF